MDCYSNQTRPEFRRPPVPMPNPSANMDYGRQPIPQFNSPVMTLPASPVCPGSVTGAVESLPVGIGYVPWQQWGQTYPLDRSLQRGTIFPELDLPFLMGRCS